MSPATDDLQQSFRTHANYLRAFARLAGFEYWPAQDGKTLEKLAQSVVTAFPRTATPPPADREEMAKCLNRAWGTELLLNLGARFEEDELVRLSNSWGSVQTYYVGYAATQALIVAEGRARPTTHPKTQDQGGTLWVTRQASVAPFSFAAKAGSKTNPIAYANGPGRSIDMAVHSWKACDANNCWDIAATALRTTREDAVKKRYQDLRIKKARDIKKAWEDEEQTRLGQGKKARKRPDFPATSNLAPSEKAAAEAKVRPYTMLDYLFRLRIKANYEEARMFTEEPDSESISSLVALDMVRIASATMIAHEARIAQLLGKNAISDIADDWIKTNSPPARMGIRRRLPILRGVL
ncbi:hypothetical protein [Mycobacterium marinum]|uniref:hypothetical protein n=1 Tax=Mycobacterium marinum TaxID=1781 RepID=UPI00235913F4|nr:hypothetical protein [Mycobacterium marinum]MDC8971484.1 hypothetical protein [Mycobacterium marinum]